VVAELRQPSAGMMLGGPDLVVERLRGEGVLVVGLPQDARAYRASPLARAVRSADLSADERGER
jgi:hypothetical protein